MTTPNNILPGSLDEGRRRLGALIVSLAPLGQLSNEAETRFHFIDRFLTECLGWDKSKIHVEINEQGDYADYELGQPRSMIFEAKKAGLPFEIPIQQGSKKVLIPIAALFEIDVALSAAITQCQEYCVKRGVQYGVVLNGHQLIAFLATRSDGIAPLKGKALVLNGEGQLLAHFPLIWQNLTPEGVNAENLTGLLSSGPISGIPRKLSSYLIEYPKYRYRSTRQEDLRTVADLLLEDLTNVPTLEPEFYRKCYCESGALSNFALTSKTILKARYAALFSSREGAPHITSVTDKEAGLGVDSVLAEALAKRPIVLIGDVGVGKTSFLKNLIYVRAETEFRDAIYVYLDLGSQGALEKDLNDFVIEELEKQLLERYSIDTREKQFVRGVYDLDVKRFRQSIWGDLYERDRTSYDNKLLEFLDKKLSNKAAHLQQSIKHISRGRSKTVILVLDNADQRRLEVQQAAFIIAQNFAKEWDALVFIAVRPQTFH